MSHNTVIQEKDHTPCDPKGSANLARATAEGRRTSHCDSPPNAFGIWPPAAWVAERNPGQRPLQAWGLVAGDGATSGSGDRVKGQAVPADLKGTKEEAKRLKKEKEAAALPVRFRRELVDDVGFITIPKASAEGRGAGLGK